MTKNIIVFLGVMANIGGVRKYRKISDMKDTIAGTDAAFGRAIDKARNRKLPGSKLISLINYQNQWKQNNLIAFVTC